MTRRIAALVIAGLLAASAAAPASVLADTPSPADVAAEDIRDARGPVALPDPWWVVAAPWIAAALAVAAAAAGARAVLARRKTRDAREVALAELALARTAIANADPERFSVLVSEAVRRYIEARFAIEAPTRTTDELLRELAADAASPLREHRGELADLLELCDRARFAAFALADVEMLAMHEAAVRFVEASWPRAERAAPAAGTAGGPT